MAEDTKIVTKKTAPKPAATGTTTRRTTTRKSAPEPVPAPPAQVIEPAATPAPPATRGGAARKASQAAVPSPVSSEARERMIREAAYYIAERRASEGLPGDPAQDWLDAVAQIDAQLGQAPAGEA